VESGCGESIKRFIGFRAMDSWLNHSRDKSMKRWID